MSKPDKAAIQALVRRSLDKVLAGSATTGARDGGNRLRAAPGTLTESHLIEVQPGTTLEVPRGTLVTPSAREWALFKRIELVEEGAPAAPVATPPSGASASPPHRTVAIGADHGGFAMKEALRPFLVELGFGVLDCGPDSDAAVDYPDYAFAVASLVSGGTCGNGICVDGAGIGSCMAANKVPGVRAAHCYDVSTALNAREHNYANFLTLGSGLTGPNLAKQIVKTFLRTPFGAARHGKRVDKIMGIEKRFSKR